MDLHGIENDLPLYTYEALASATDNFHSGNKLGKGGFGQVFKVIFVIFMFLLLAKELQNV